MTPLTKRVQRRCTTTRDGGRRIIVAMDPGDDLMFRLERGKKWFRVPVIDIYHFAIKRELGLKQVARRRGAKGAL